MSLSGSEGPSRRLVLGALAAMPALPGLLDATTAQAETGDPLPSWNDGPAKRAILDFVRATTDPSSKDFVPLQERIAEFDQDGTLWVEHPIYTQIMFCLEHVPNLVKARPELASVVRIAPGVNVGSGKAMASCPSAGLASAAMSASAPAADRVMARHE